MEPIFLMFSVSYKNGVEGVKYKLFFHARTRD